jgi:flagellar export protein FliJ
MTRRRFQFQLEPLRTLRENAELNVMKELAGELAHAHALQAEAAAVERRLAEARTPSSATTAADLSARQAYVERLERELDETRQRERIQERRVEETRARLALAVRDRQTLDRLEQRRRAVHDLELRRVERTDADEISLLSHLGSGHAA